MVHLGASPKRCLKIADQRVAQILLAILPLICIIVNEGCLKLNSGARRSYLCLGLTRGASRWSGAEEMFEKR